MREELRRRRGLAPEASLPLLGLFKPWLQNELRHQFNCLKGVRGYSIVGRVLVTVWLLFAFVFLKPRIAGVESWRLPQYFFPQIDFSRPRIDDPIRALVQLLWLMFVRPRSARRSVKKTVGTARYFVKHYRAMLAVLLAWFRMVLEWGNRHTESHVDGTVSANLKSRSTQSFWGQFSWRDGLLLAAVLALSLLCITVPFSLEAQAAFVCALLFMAWILQRMPGRFSNMLLIVLSLLVSTRYIWWRSTNTLNWDSPVGLGFGIVLLAAEIYAWVVLVLGYFQNIWPLKRTPQALPEDTTTWPSIDLFIPTYNEELDVVKATVYASLGLDWPQDKLNIHILDDGKRDSFRDFAAQVGVNYIRRPVNNHAKAGNINYALTKTNAEYVAIFDCDHIPTRAFFQMTMGWLIKDPNLALVQTPHHFYSPDPFERNLATFRKIPNEGNLFYGLIQDGNDLWGGTFFCGSCAILRRKPLEEVGGIAVETVTEDAHTSLRMHRKGYGSAYLRAPISAGLATETLSAHIGQRIRWARGMAQILRLDNPLTGPGLRWHQRLCYFNAMLHFLSGVPRLIFLTAPLAFLLLHTYIIYAPALVLLMYVIPHMVHTSSVNSMLQGKYRYSFWGEVYESVLAWYVARPTTVALFAPHKGTFNVTAKGGTIERDYYDWVISKPYIALVILNVAGIIWGIGRMFYGPSEEISAVVVNLMWTFYNMLILGAAAAVGAEAKQVRTAPRVDVNIPASLILPTGHRIQATVRDFSFGGLRFEVEDSSLLRNSSDLDVVLQRGNEELIFPLHVVYAKDGVLGTRLPSLSVRQTIDYVQCTFAKADTWVHWKESYEEDVPVISMGQVVCAALQGYSRLLRNSPKPIPQVYAVVIWMVSGLATFRPRSVAMEVAN